MSSVNDAVHIVDIAVQPTRSNMVYAATLPNNSSDNSAGGLYVSVDGGATWTLNQSLGHVCSVPWLSTLFGQRRFTWAATAKECFEVRMPARPGLE